MQNLGQDHEYDQSDEGRQHEQVAMGEIDHADDAVNHRVADGDQSVDRPQREPVDQLLQEIIHAPTRPPVSLRFAGNVPSTSGRPVLLRSRSAEVARRRHRSAFHSLAGAVACGNPRAGPDPRARLGAPNELRNAEAPGVIFTRIYRLPRRSLLGTTIPPEAQLRRSRLEAFSWKIRRRLDICRALRNAVGAPIADLGPCDRKRRDGSGNSREARKRSWR